MWTESGKTAGDSISVGGYYTEDDPEKIDVMPGYGAGENWGTTVKAQTTRDGLFIVRGIVPYDRNNNKFKAVVTDKVGNTSSNAMITGVDFDDKVDEEL